jgi:hypothetical protein
MRTHESAAPDRREHAKEGKHVDEDDLQARTAYEPRRVNSEPRIRQVNA